MKTRHIALALGLAALLAAGCSKKEEGKSSGTGEPTGAKTSEATGTKPAGEVDMTKAKAIFAERCTACHGADGKGDGPGAAALTPKPRDFADKSWQTSVTDEHIKKTILLGGAAVGKSPMMPANPDLEGKPEVVEGLVKVVRDFGK